MIATFVSIASNKVKFNIWFFEDNWIGIRWCQDNRTSECGF